jgi:hypothetical protein
VLYEPGQTLWRIPIRHFSVWDWNLGWGPDGAGTPPGEECAPEEVEDKPDCAKGSIIECENQILGESIGITGTGVNLSYTSLRARARKVERTIRIPLTSATLPAGLQAVRLRVTVAGQSYEASFAAAPNLQTTYVWDGKDNLGREVQGSMNAVVRLAYVYPIVYRNAASFGTVASFPYFRNDLRRVGNEVEVERVWNFRLLNYPATPANSLGGWTLSAQHNIDLGSGMLYRGDGGHEQKAQPRGDLIFRAYNSGAVAPAPDGSLYYPEGRVIYRLRPDRTRQLVAGNPTLPPGFSGDGGLAVTARLSYVNDLALADDGTLYVLDSGTPDYANLRVRRITPDGIITTYAGNGLRGITGDGGPATAAAIGDDGFNLLHLAVGPDGSVYIATTFRIRRVDPSGLIDTIAGSTCENADCDSGNGGPAKNARFSTGGGLAVGADGSIVFGQASRHIVKRITPDGIIRRIGGIGTNGNTGYGVTGDGGLALAAEMSPHDVAVGHDGSVYVSEHGFNASWVTVVRRIDPAGIITRIAGLGHESCLEASGVSALNLCLSLGSSIALG